MTRRVNQFSPRWWKTERIQHNQDLQPNGYPAGGGTGSGKGLELWSSTKNYVKDDVVFFNSPDVKGIFVANENIAASGFLNIGVDGPTWSVVGDEFASIPNWYSMEWPANSVVVKAGALRRAIVNTDAGWNDAQWEVLSAGGAQETETLFKDHNQNEAYVKDAVVVQAAKLYRARGPIAAKPFDANDWEEVSKSNAAGLTEIAIYDFDTSYAYKANELCTIGDKLYRAIKNTGPGTIINGDWKEISPAGSSTAVVPDFNTSKTYAINELVIQGGRMYRATQAVAAGAFSLSNFAPADATGIVDAFDPTAAYNKGEIVRHQGSFFMSAANIAAGPFSLASNNWAYIGGGTVNTTDWNNSLFYPFGAMVFKDKAVYRSKSNQMAGAWVDNQWEPIASLHGRLSAFNGTETYYKDMVATFNGYVYRVTTVTAAPAATPEGNASWQKLWATSLYPNLVAYTTNAAYRTGDLVLTEGRILRANKDIGTAPVSVAVADWEPTANLTLATWSAATACFVGDTFVDNGVLYRCKVASRGAWSATNFEQIGQIDQLKEYDSTKKYVLGQVVTRNGQILRCESAVSAIGYDSDDWDMIGHLKGVRPWADWDTYEKNDVVLHLGVAWQASGHVPAGPFSFGPWNRKSGTPAIAEFIPDFPYDIGDIIKVGNKLYINKVGMYRLTIDMNDWTQFGQLRGLWALDQTYLAEDIVINGNNIYRANGAIPANTAFVQGTGTAEWTRLSPSEPPSAPDFAPLQAYKKDSLVIRGGKLYRSKADFTALASWDDNDWQALVAEAAASVPDFVLAKDYVLNQVVAQDGVLYRARSVITAVQADKLPAADPAKWQAVSLTYIHVPDHSATGTYALNECVINPADNRMYRAKVKITTGRAFADVDWQLIADRVPNVVEWDTVTAANNVWYLGDIVIKDEGVYIASKNQSTGSLVWPAADVKRINIASNFYGYIGDTSHDLPVGAIFINNRGDLIQMLKKDLAVTADQSATKVISNGRIREWVSGTQYIEGVAVHHKGVYYFALRPNNNKVPEANAADWEVAHDPRAWFAFWSSSKNYLNGEVVIRGGQFYQATADNAAGTFESGSWALISGAQTQVKPWINTKANNVWRVGDFIKRYGVIYLAEAASDAAGEDTWPNTKLKPLLDESHLLGTEQDATLRIVKIGDVFIGEFGHICRYTVAGDPTTFTGMYYDIINFNLDKLAGWSARDYQLGYFVTHKNRIYRAKMIAVSVNEPGVDENTWEEVAPTRVIADNFSETRTYVENELAVYGGKLYRAKALTVAAVWDASKWEAIGGGGGVEAWSATKDYTAGTIVTFDQAPYRATFDIAATTDTPHVDNRWVPENKATGIAKLNALENVKAGDMRMHNKMAIMAQADHAVAATLDGVELAQWDVAFGVMGNATFTAKKYIADGSALDFSVGADWTKGGAITLPGTDDFLYWKNAGARFYLNGHPITGGASAFVVKGFTLSGNYIESGDVISVEF